MTNRTTTSTLTACMAKWRPASNGSNKRHWFLIDENQQPYRGKRRQLVRFSSYETALRAASRKSGSWCSVPGYPCGGQPRRENHERI